MFSYRHAFHAGNHADVLKHFIQVQLHQYMNQKDAAYTYIDTHSGAGVYALDSAQAVKSGEYLDGIARLWERDDLPPALADYVNLVRAMNPSGRLRYYPGSPYVAEQVARPEDRLRLFELHPADTRLLVDNFRKLEAHKAEQGERSRGRRILIDHADGFHGLKALLPPPSRRALVLIDPPYEVKLDYKHVRDALEEALGRFPTGIYAVWYPVLQRMESRQFADRLKRLPAKEWLHVTLTVATPGPDGTGMHSSGMFILNPPYTLEPMLRETMPYLVQVLGQDSGATFRIEKGSQVTGTTVGTRGLDSGPRKPVGNARRASPLSGAGSLRLPGQPFGEGPRKREGAGTGTGAGKEAAGERPAQPSAAPAKKKVPAFRYADQNQSAARSNKRKTPGRG
ncbi:MULTISPECIES: 23S rRNA (adenine(2030)-N(6))-methyltransferase RlmJ [unclassified Massilia]|uniref:23S rRNA (adenine(2030)-N(6))-methyltransferase RlmJ n=1 Tax=unclassified Massilia TaxID=2609279 RepID=UPI0009EC5459|nr:MULTISPECIES: 23S rRNA (adenine(2030)-N(6))-methyltransferase RlmJ [unclassified Massilia]